MLDTVFNNRTQKCIVVVSIEEAPEGRINYTIGHTVVDTPIRLLQGIECKFKQLERPHMQHSQPPCSLLSKPIRLIYIVKFVYAS